MHAGDARSGMFPRAVLFCAPSEKLMKISLAIPIGILLPVAPDRF
jgi:hypothetical protein